MNNISDRFSFWWVGLIAMAIGVFTVTGSFIYTIPDRASGDITRTGLFSIRVKNGKTFDFNHYYTIQTAEKGAWFWLDIYYRESDEPVYDSADTTVTVVKEDVAYISLDTTFAVTTDAGRSWTFFDTRSSEFEKTNYGYGQIRYTNKTRINPDGTGTIDLQVHEAKSQPRTRFTTSDFGKTWAESTF